jgi:Xaa-Pro aminopeptidase
MLLSYTTLSDENTDVITHSSYLRVTKLFRKIYNENNKKFKVKSSEMNIYDIISKNSNDDIEKIKLLANLTDEILKKSFNSIKPFQNEIEIANNTKEITLSYLNNVKEKYDIIDYDFAWDICPIVLVGKNLKKGGHALPSDKKIMPGDTIYYDFGIKATFKNGHTYYTDMQRMGYLLKDDEDDAPDSVKNVFNTLVISIQKGIDKMKSGVKAYKIDEIVRGEILKNNYPDYPHATGHPVGKDVHGAGALISLKGSKRANLKLVETGIYTLEPRIDIENGGSIEEMILVTNSGAIPLCNTQKELYLI